MSKQRLKANTVTGTPHEELQAATEASLTSDRPSLPYRILETRFMESDDEKLIAAFAKSTDAYHYIQQLPADWEKRYILRTLPAGDSR